MTDTPKTEGAYHGDDLVEFTAHEMRLLHAGEAVRGYRWVYQEGARPCGELVLIERYVGIIDTRRGR